VNITRTNTAREMVKHSPTMVDARYSSTTMPLVSSAVFTRTFHFLQHSYRSCRHTGWSDHRIIKKAYWNLPI